MNFRMKVLVVCYVFILLLSEAAFGDKEDKSGEEPNLEGNETKLQNESSIDDGPPDSHEAMNNRPLKPKITSSIREKRSYEFLIGLLNNNSRYEVTNTETITDGNSKREKKTSDDSIRASEVLLELLVKIAAHPSQWEQVHNLLRKIDTDLTTSKNLYHTINPNQNLNNDLDGNGNVKQEVEEIMKQHENYLKTQNVDDELEIARRNGNVDEIVKTNNTDTQVQKMIVILNGQNHNKNQNVTEYAMKKNQWPVFDSNDENYVTETTDMTKYPWQLKTTTKNTYPRNFAYHRVTGKPFNKDKNPKAYIAVSVIAPKPINTRSKMNDVTLENQLKELKPWTHSQNLKNMAAIRSRWVIQTDEEKKENYAP